MKKFSFTLVLHSFLWAKNHSNNTPWIVSTIHLRVMFKTTNRFLSFGRPLLNQTVAPSSAVPRFHVKLAATQFAEPGANRRRERRLRRTEKRMKKQIIRDVNTLKQYEVKNVPLTVDPVLGDSKCTFIPRIMEKVDNQELTLAYGIDRAEFEKLLYAAEKIALEKASNNEALRESVIETEENKKRAVLTILNLKNTNTPDRKKMAIKFAREEMQRDSGDTASPEVQAGILTVKIHYGMQQVKNMPKDKINIQNVRELVQHRQRLLKYLKKQDPKKYYYTIAKLGLTDDAVVREFNMSKQYMQDFKVWGDKVLVRETNSVAKKNQKIKDLKNRIAAYNDLAKRNYEILTGKK